MGLMLGAFTALAPADVLAPMGVVGGAAIAAFVTLTDVGAKRDEKRVTVGW